jgi:hypothetical protein
MRQLILIAFTLFACSTHRQVPNEMILGSWLYVTAESLGDYSQNDKESIAEFDKSMEGKVMTFYKDSTYKATIKTGGKESILQTGKYSIASDGKSMTMGNKESTKISLTDSILKIYSPNNGIFVFRKLKE